MNEQVVIVTSAGVARLQDEATRIAGIKARGCVPKQCGPVIPEAPARGAYQVFEPMGLQQGSDGTLRVERMGHEGRSAIRGADVFDVMAAKAASHKKPPPFSPGQVAMGRHYRDLVERHECAGVKCSSIEVLSSGGSGQGGEFMDAVLRDREQIERLRRNLGLGVSLRVRRVRPSTQEDDGIERAAITDRALVDCVCLHDRPLTEVLRIHGWVREGKPAPGKYITMLRRALGEALDRMAGPVRNGGVAVKHYGMPQDRIWK